MAADLFTRKLGVFAEGNFRNRNPTVAFGIPGTPQAAQRQIMGGLDKPSNPVLQFLVWRASLT